MEFSDEKMLVERASLSDFVTESKHYMLTPARPQILILSLWLASALSGCSQGPGLSVGRIEREKLQKVKVSEGDAASESTIENGPATASGNAGVPSPSTEKIKAAPAPSLNCLGGVLEDNHDFAYAAQQRTLQYNDQKTSLCNLLRLNQSNASVIHILPSPCDQACLEATLNLGFAIGRSEFGNNLSLILIALESDPEMETSLQNFFTQHSLPFPVMAFDPDGLTLSHLADAENAPGPSQFFAISPDLRMNAIRDDAGLYLEIVNLAEFLAESTGATGLQKSPASLWDGTDFQENGFIDLVSLTSPDGGEL